MVEKQTARVEAGTTAVSTVAKPIDGHWSPGPIETAGALSLSVWPTFLPAGRRGRTALLLLIVLAGWFFAVGLSHSRLTAVGRGDLAEYVNNPVRLLYGELPYRDFWLLHPPGEVLLPAAIYALGFGMDTVFLASLVINVLVGLAAFVIVRRLVRSNAEPVLAAAIVFFAGVPYTYNAYVSLQAYFLCLLVAAGFLFDYLRCHDRRSLFAASLAVGVGATFKFYLTGAAAAAMLAMVLLDAHRRRCRGQEMARLIAAFAAGAVLPLAAVALYFAELWPDFWYAIAMDSISHATVMRPTYGHKLLEMWADAVPVLRELRLHPFAWTSAGIVTLSRLIEMTTIHLIPFMAGGLWWYSRRKRIIPRHLAGRAVLFFLLWGGLTFIRGYVRGSGSSLVQSATPLYIVLVLLMRPLMAFARESQTSGARLAAACALLPLVGLGQWVATVTVHEALSLRQPEHRVIAPHGVLVYADVAQAAEVRSLIAAVVENSREGDYLFVTPWSSPPLYALTRRRNPTYYDSLIDLTHRPSEEKQRRVCTDLLAHDTRLVVHQPGCDTGSGTFENGCPLIDECLRTHFEPFQQCGPYFVWRRKGVQEAKLVVPDRPGDVLRDQPR